MKMSMPKMLVVLAIVLSFTAVQDVYAEETPVTGTIEGTIERIGTGSIDVVASDGTIYTFYDIPFSVLEDLSVGDMVSVEAYQVTFPNGMVKDIAYSITVGGATYTWHPNVPKVGNKAGARTVTLSTTDEYGQPCHCNCIENTVCLECYCYCRANR